MAPTLGYWNVRGLGEPIRYLLAYSGTDYEDKRYGSNPGSPDPRSEWLNDKNKLGFDFPNLPYYIDGDIKLTQSLAILRYIARKTKLDGKNEEEKRRIDLAEQQLVDYNQAFSRLVYDPDFDNLKADYIKTTAQNLQQLSKFLGNRPFIAGDNVSYVDFVAYEVLDKNNLLTSGEVTKVDNLKKFMERIEAFPQIAKYIKTAPRGGFAGPQAKWGAMKA